MKIFGRQISNWWLLLVAVILVVCSPLLLMGFFAANNLAGAIIGPPAIWNRTGHTPPRNDVVGDYVESERRLGSDIKGPPATLSLHADGTMVVKGLPFDEYPGYCVWSGEGQWCLVDDDCANVDLDVLTVGSDNTCSHANGDSKIELAGHSQPYKLYWIVGDPDSGTGVWLVKKR